MGEGVVTGSEITRSLQELGIESGDVVLFHSALSSLGYLPGGQETLIDVVLGAVGPSGTTMVPCFPPFGKPFRPSSSPSMVGSVTEAFRLRDGAVRSLHPTHSVAAIGRQARDLTEGHETCRPCGPGSPYDKLRGLGGWILLIGVDQDRNTSLHMAEDFVDTPYLHSFDAILVREDGAHQIVPVERCAGGHREFIGVDKRLREAGIVRVGHVGGATLRLMPAQALFDYCVSLLEEDMTAFLCSKPRCTFCRWAEGQVRESQTGERDPVNWREVAYEWGCGDETCEVCYPEIWIEKLFPSRVTGPAVISVQAGRNVCAGSHGDEEVL